MTQNFIPNNAPNGTNANTAFPIACFPEKIQEIIRQLERANNYPPEFTACSILFAASVAIGSSYRVRIKKEWEYNTSIWICLVAPPGTGKSHPLAFALKPINKKDGEAIDNYRSAYRGYKANSGKNKDLEPPLMKHIIVTDSTPEAIAQALENNPAGIGFYADELTNWFGNFGRYSKGNEEGFWVSCWSEALSSITRKNGAPIFIPNPFLSVGGTTQPSTLEKLHSGNRDLNGFTHRILFSVIQNLKKKPTNDIDLDEHIQKDWYQIINRLLSYRDNMQPPHFEPQILRFSERAGELYRRWSDGWAERSNEAEEDSTKGIMSKIEAYVAKLALILEILIRSCEDKAPKEIGEDAMEGALQMAEYFLTMALLAESIASNGVGKKKLTEIKRSFIETLPNVFETRVAHEIAVSMDIPIRTCDHLLSNPLYFSRVSHGKYRKV